jgi:quercetin dioxygenase-like cupin family protein
VTQPLSLDDLRRSPVSALFEGHRHGAVALSFYVTTFPPGRGPGLHLHPYPEVFLVEAGEGVFTIGDAEHRAGADSVLAVPAETPHRFVNGGEGTLRVLSLHPSERVIQTDL